MSVDPTNFASIIHEAAAAEAELGPEIRVAMLLWSSSQTFASTTFPRDVRFDEYDFVDRVMRLYAGALAKLDPAAARAYLAALSDRNDKALPPQLRAEGERRRAEAWARLRLALAGAAQPVQGHC